MNLRRLRSFVIVAEEENIGRAARRLRLAQPALTRQIQALEREVGVSLLARHARGVRLTPAGAALLEHARGLLAAADAAVATVRDVATGQRAEKLRISTPDWSRAARAVSRAVEAFHRALPTVEIEFDETPWVQHPLALLDGVIDVGFGIAMNPHDFGPELAAERLLDEPASSAVIAATHPLARRGSVTLADLRGIPLLVPAREIAPRLHDMMVETVRRGGYEPQVRNSSPSFALTAQMIVAGAGWTISTSSISSEPPPGAAVLPITDAVVMLGFFVLHRAGDERTSVREFLRQIRAAVVER